uniref:Uncharacterized protein n=1 Tax=Romanomermis culicivorax TaxID=13658 RepID=A0A915HWH7_ROMCU
MRGARNFTRLLDEEFKESTYLLWLFSFATFWTAILAVISLPLNILSTKVLFHCKEQVPKVVRLFTIIYNLALLQRLIMINWKWIYQLCSLIFGFANFRAILGWSIPFSKTIMEIANSRINKRSAPYCQSMFLKKEDSTLDATAAPVIVQLSLMLISLCLMCYIKWLNKKRLDQFNLLSTTHNLASRFTLWSNFNTSKWLIPMTLVNLVFRITSEIIQLIFQTIQDQDAHTIGISSCTLFLAAVESFFYPVAFFRYNVTFSTSLLDMNPRYFASKNLLSRMMTGRKVNRVAASFNTKEFSRAALNTIEFRQKPEQNVDIVLKMWEKAELDMKGSKTVRG